MLVTREAIRNQEGVKYRFHIPGICENVGGCHKGNRFIEHYKTCQELRFIKGGQVVNVNEGTKAFRDP